MSDLRYPVVLLVLDADGALSVLGPDGTTADRLLDPDAAAGLLGCHRATVTRWADSVRYSPDGPGPTWPGRVACGHVVVLGQLLLRESALREWVAVAYPDGVRRGPSPVRTGAAS